MYPTYNHSGIELSWLSNYPDEDEILYMNTTFQITDILDPKTEKSIMANASMDQSPQPFTGQGSFNQQQLINAIQNISVNSNILSLNTSTNNPLSDKDLILTLCLLYLQYKQSRWMKYAINVIWLNHYQI